MAIQIDRIQTEQKKSRPLARRLIPPQFHRLAQGAGHFIYSIPIPSWITQIKTNWLPARSASTPKRRATPHAGSHPFLTDIFRVPSHGAGGGQLFPRLNGQSPLQSTTPVANPNSTDYVIDTFNNHFGRPGNIVFSLFTFSPAGYRRALTEGLLRYVKSINVAPFCSSGIFNKYGSFFLCRASLTVNPNYGSAS